MKILRFIFGDQLNYNISSMKDIDKDKDLILMCEIMKEAKYVKYHKKKLLFFFSSMRHFAKELQENNFNIIYIKLNDAQNTQSFKSEITRIAKKEKIDQIILTSPSNYSTLQEIKNINLNIEIREDDRFLCSKDEFKKIANNKKSLLMESFYRKMRIKYDILMKDKKPIGGKFNFDKENRKFPKNNINIPQIIKIPMSNITKELIYLVEKEFSDHFGDIYPFNFAVTRKDALILLDDFIKNRLVNFGNFQDAMIEGEDFLYHSSLSHYINNGLLTPLEIIKKIENSYYEQKIALNSVEGFIRQILGWREFINAIYWLKMPEYKNYNFFNSKNKLPEFYWGADVKMNCIMQSIKNTKKNAYAHHIQRLMILGNFALLAGIDPKYVNEWYLIVYADAYEWVELPNVSGMILFADGGFLASKPYAASGSYINKMSNYCKNCHYDVKIKNGKKACPFNYLYWNFLIKNKEKLYDNHRLRMIYKKLLDFSEEKINLIKNDSKDFLESLN